MKNFSPNKAIEYNGTKFRSKLEASFAKLFTRLGIKYEYETIRIPYLDSEGKSHLYFLDFYLPDYETVIEVKPVKFLYEILESPKLPYALHSKYRLIILTERDISRKAISQLLPGAVSGKTVSDWSHHTDSNIKLLSVC